MVIQLGAQGAPAWTADGETARLRAVPVTPIDAVGAGDGFAAGYLGGFPRRGRACRDELIKVPPSGPWSPLAAATSLPCLPAPRSTNYSPQQPLPYPQRHHRHSQDNPCATEHSSTLTRTTLTTDVVIIGSGMGGGTLAWALKDTGLDVLIVERGGFLPREPQNSEPDQVYIKGRYVTAGRGTTPRPANRSSPASITGWAGTPRCTAPACPVSVAATSTRSAHQEGLSPAWPFSYDDLEPFYAKAEQLFEVHGQSGRTPPNPNTPPATRTRRSATNPIEQFADGCGRRACIPSTCPMACT